MAGTAFEPERDIGLAGIHPVEGPCLAIRSEGIPTGAAVTLVSPQSQKILVARVAGPLDGSCVTGSYPALLGDHDDSVYLLDLVEGTMRPGDVLIATLVPPSRYAVRGQRVRAELDGREPEESFRLCLSAEGLHLTVWSGEPLTGRRRWHDYHYLGFELDEAAQDCTEADYSELTSLELTRAVTRLAAGVSTAEESDKGALVDAGEFDCLPIAVFGLKGIRLWQPEETIARELGKPSSISEGSGEDDGGWYDVHTYHYPRLRVDVVRGMVDRIVTDSSGTGTAFGVNIGDSLKEVITKLGSKPRDWKEGADQVDLVTCPQDGEWIQEDYVTFRFDGKRHLVSIAFEANRP